MHGGMSGEMPCADGLEDCLIDDEINHDGRAGQLKTDEGQQGVNIGALDPPQPVALPENDRSPPRYASVHPGAPPPKHLLNCVFLD